jgi:predicted nucleic acid-binding protein
MKVYFDMCCLKRPFGAQDEALVRLETEAIMNLLAAPPDLITAVRTPALVLENSFNPVECRRVAVELWVSLGPLEIPPVEQLVPRTRELQNRGLKNFDAFHLASAEAVRSDVLVTVDDRFLRKARTLAADLAVRVSGPIELAQEVFQWKA